MTTDVDETSGSLWKASAAEPDWEAVYTEQLPRVYNFMRYRMGNEVLAQDLTSRTFEKRGGRGIGIAGILREYPPGCCASPGMSS